MALPQGLRIDEAMHNPYGHWSLWRVDAEPERRTNSSGRAVEIRLQIHKSIVRISFTEEMPPTSWNMSAPQGGFYSNVNPLVHHPRWSQAKERRLGGPTNIFGFTPKRPTLMFNGYEEEVASIYQGMDLIRNY